MNQSKLILFFILLTWLVFISCKTDKKEDITVAERNEESAIDKEKIKAFWDTFRAAQRLRTEGKWLEAAKSYEMAIRIDSLHEDSWFYLGNMYLEISQYKKAEACWKQIVSLNPNSAKSHMQLGRLYLSFERPETFDLDKAKSEFMEASAINKVITGPLMLLGHVALLEGNFDQAENYFKKVTGTDIKNVEAYFLLGYIYWKNKDLPQSRTWFDIAVANSIPEKAVKGVLSEGDTREGISYLRPINVSIFHNYFANLHSIDKNKIEDEMNERFSSLNRRIMNIDQLIFKNELVN